MDTETRNQSVHNARKQSFFVKTDTGTEFNVLFSGDLAKLSVAKIRRYLKAKEIPEPFFLFSNDQLLDEDMVGGDFGLSNGSILRLSSDYSSPHNISSHQSETLRKRLDNRLGSEYSFEAISAILKESQNTSHLTLPKAQEYHDLTDSRTDYFGQTDKREGQNLRSDAMEKQKLFSNKEIFKEDQKTSFSSTMDYVHDAELLKTLNRLNYDGKKQGSGTNEYLDEISSRLKFSENGHPLLIPQTTLHSSNSVNTSDDLSIATNKNYSIPIHLESNTARSARILHGNSIFFEDYSNTNAHSQICSRANGDEPKIMPNDKPSPKDGNQSRFSNLKHFQDNVESVCTDDNNSLLVDRDGSSNQAHVNKIIFPKYEEVATKDTECANNSLRHVKLRQKATECVDYLSKIIGQPLSLSKSGSCAIGNENNDAIIITYDPFSEYLYIYAPLLTSIPKDPTIRLQLYELLLDGAFLGREMAGGGCGVSSRNDLVMMHTSIPVFNCTTDSLSKKLPRFVRDLQHWRDIVGPFVEKNFS